MRIRIGFLVMVGFLMPAALAYCGQTSRIELNDGSVINAEVLSLNNGAYTINSSTLGTVTIDSSRIRRIEPQETAAAGGSAMPASSVKSEMDKYKTAMMNNPDILRIINDLTSDPQFQKLMEDPEVMKAINSGDIQTLMSNQKFMEAANNPRVNEIKNKLKQ